MSTVKRIQKAQKAIDQVSNHRLSLKIGLSRLESIYGRILHKVGELYVTHTGKVKEEIEQTEKFLKSVGR